MPKVVFTPAGSSIEVAEGTSVLDAARRLGVDLDSVCGGRGVCGRCQVLPASGSHPKWGVEVPPEALSEFGATEQMYRDRRGLADGRRLGCCAHVHDDVVVDVPPDSQVHRPVVRKELDLFDVVLDPAVQLRYVVLPHRDLAEDRSLTELVSEALADQHGVSADGFDLSALDDLVSAFAGASGTIALRDGRVAAAWPGYHDRVLGVAVDIGSTTLAGHLCDLLTGEVLASAGRMNPQIRFGDDLMSRVSYVMLNDGGRQALTEAVRSALVALVDDLCADAEMVRSDVLEIVLVGNPVMHHLVLGIDPTPLGQAPFTLTIADAVRVSAPALDLPLPRAAVYVGPCIAGHVGADTAAVLLHEAPHHSEAVELIVDVGTNAEILLGCSSWLLAASSPTGPAFEGAQLSCGQRATIGAIERVRIDRLTLEPRFKVIGSDLWSDDEGFTEVAASLGVTGVCGSGIIEVIAEMYLAGVIDADGALVASGAERSPRVFSDGRTFSYLLHDDGVRRLYITQNDVRAIQLAKAALRAGIELLMSHAGVAEVDAVRLAGAFGSHIDPFHALVLGLVPDCPVDHVRSVGNAAGAGAVRALLSRTARQEMEDAVRTVTKIETATEQRFQEEFVAAMAFPHGTAPSPHLAQLTELPSRVARPDERRSRRRRGDA